MYFLSMVGIIQTDNNIDYYNVLNIYYYDHGPHDTSGCSNGGSSRGSRRIS